MIVNKMDLDLLNRFNNIKDENNGATDPLSSAKHAENCVPDFNKVVSKLEKEDNKLRLIHSDFSWLRGKENERAIYWSWLFIMQLPWSRICNDAGETKSPYTRFKLPERTINTKMRSDIIKVFFDSLSEKYSHGSARHVYQDMLFIWTHFISNVRRTFWLKNKNEEELDWAWDYLSKKPEINSGSLSWFYPVNESEKRLAIVAAIDSCKLYIDDYPCVFSSLEGCVMNNPGILRNVNFRKTLLNDMRLTYEQNKRRAINKKKGKRVAINAEISPVTKDRVVEMASVRGIQINRLIEKLINNEYMAFKQQRK